MDQSFTVLAAAMLTANSCFSEPVSQKNSWPRIMEVDQQFTASLARDGFERHIDIFSSTDHKLYRISCYSGDDANQDKWSSKTPVIPIADLSCVMFGEEQNRPWMSLLSEASATRDYQSRGFFWKSQLSGKCGTYPEYGRNRTFKLRGMEVVIELSRSERENNWLVRIRVKNVADNKSEWAEDPGVAEHVDECH